MSMGRARGFEAAGQGLMGIGQLVGDLRRRRREEEEREEERAMGRVFDEVALAERGVHRGDMPSSRVTPGIEDLPRGEFDRPDFVPEPTEPAGLEGFAEVPDFGVDREPRQIDQVQRGIRNIGPEDQGFWMEDPEVREDRLTQLAAQRAREEREDMLANLGEAYGTAATGGELEPAQTGLLLESGAMPRHEAPNYQRVTHGGRAYRFNPASGEMEPIEGVPVDTGTGQGDSPPRLQRFTHGGVVYTFNPVSGETRPAEGVPVEEQGGREVMPGTVEWIRLSEELYDRYGTEWTLLDPEEQDRLIRERAQGGAARLPETAMPEPEPEPERASGGIGETLRGGALSAMGPVARGLGAAQDIGRGVRGFFAGDDLQEEDPEAMRAELPRGPEGDFDLGRVPEPTDDPELEPRAVPEAAAEPVTEEVPVVEPDVTGEPDVTEEPGAPEITEDELDALRAEIAALRGEGVDDDVIRSELEGAGYTPAEIRRIMGGG